MQGREVMAMQIKLYKNPQTTGWLGWIEGTNEKTIGFVRLDGTVQFGW